MKATILLGFLLLSACVPNLHKGNFSFRVKQKTFEQLSVDNSLAFKQLRIDFLDAQCIRCHHHENYKVEAEFLKRGIRPGHPELSGKYTIITSGKMPPDRRGTPADRLEKLESYITSLKTPDRPEFLAFKQKVLAPNKCLQCHGFMENENEVLKYVKVGYPAEESELYQSVASGRMPIRSSPLTTEDLELVRNYVESFKTLDDR